MGMSIEQIEKRNQDIIRNAKLWATEKECDALRQLDIAILGEYLGIRIPKCFDKFVCSKNRNHAEIFGAERSIFKTLDRIAELLRR